MLETTFTTASGVASATDALTLQDGGQLSWVELMRRIRGVRGRVRFRYEVRPRFDFGGAPTSIEQRRGVYVANAGREQLVFSAWEVGEPALGQEAIVGELETRRRRSATLVCIGIVGDPIPLPPREEIELRFDQTVASWERWVDFHAYDGPLEEAVERSTLALKLLASRSARPSPTAASRCSPRTAARSTR